MKCKKCPLLYTPYEGEFNSDPICRLFGYGDDSPFLYENKNGEEGCYIDYRFIEKMAKEGQ